MGSHVFAGEVVAANDGGVAVEDGDFAVIPQVGRAARGERKHGQKTGDLAAGLTNGVHEVFAGEKAAEGVELEAHLHALAGAAGEEVDDAAADRVATEDEGGDVDGVAGGEDLALELEVGIEAGGEEAHLVAPEGLAGAVGCDRLGGGVGERGGAGPVGWQGGQIAAEAALAGGEAFYFAPSEEEKERHAHVGHKDDAEEPGDGVAGLAALSEEAGEREDREHDAADREEVRPERGLHDGVEFGERKDHVGAAEGSRCSEAKH